MYRVNVNLINRVMCVVVMESASVASVNVMPILPVQIVQNHFAQKTVWVGVYVLMGNVNAAPTQMDSIMVVLHVRSYCVQGWKNSLKFFEQRIMIINNWFNYKVTKNTSAE